jgi:hypothetical protein
MIALALGLATVTAVLAGPAAQDDAPSATQAQLDQLTAILARPEFHIAEGRGWFDRLLDPIRTALYWLLTQIFRLIVRGAAAGGEGLQIGIVLVALTVVIVVAVGVRRLLRGALVGDVELGGGRVSGPPRALDELARAQALAAEGDARGAIHHHYLAVLLRLDERDHLPFDGTLTNRELLPRIGARPELAGAFGALVAAFDRLWYGQPACSMEEYAAFARLARQVWAAAEATEPELPPDAAQTRTVTSAIAGRS